MELENNNIINNHHFDKYNFTYELSNIRQGGIVPYDEPWLRGRPHSTIKAFWMCLWTTYVGAIVYFISFFYWPLARKWTLYQSEFRWGWTLTFTKWSTVIGLGIYGIVICFFIVGIPIAILLFFYGKSIFKAFTMGRISREVYKREIYPFRFEHNQDRS